MSDKKKVLSIVGIVGVPGKYGGFETMVDNLLEFLTEEYEVEVYCQAQGLEEKPAVYKNSRLRYINLKANGIQSIFYDAVSILKSYFNADYVLILGVSGVFLLPIIKLLGRQKYIVNIDGIEWKRDKWNKLASAFLKISEKIAVRFADLVVTDNQAIQEYVKEAYGKDSEMIAYGGDNAVYYPLDAYCGIPLPLNEEYLFTVCRIEPENNIEMILEGYAKSSSKRPYIFVGNWKNSAYGILMHKKYHEVEGLYLLDPIYEMEQINALRSNCYVYVHGHSAGGTNPSLVEAMALGLAIFAYDVSYNKLTTFHKAEYFSSSTELANSLDRIGNYDLLQMKEHMTSLSKKHYTWSEIAAQYIGALNSL